MDISEMAPVGNNPKKKLKKESPEVKDVKCPVCDEIFSCWENVWSHLNNEHRLGLEECYKFLCCICGRKFRRRALLNSHFKSHTIALPFRCIICTKKYESMDQVEMHIRCKHEDHKRVYVDCRICGRYIKNTEFQKHFQKHVEEMEATPKKKKVNQKQGAQIPNSPSTNERIPSESFVENDAEKCKSLENSNETMQTGHLENGMSGKCNPNKSDNSNDVLDSTASCADNDGHSNPATSCNRCSQLSTWMANFPRITPGDRVVWEYNLMYSDCVFLKTVNGGGRFEWILEVPGLY